jgi:hypothetical protein
MKRLTKRIKDYLDKQSLKTIPIYKLCDLLILKFSLSLPEAENIIVSYFNKKSL